MNQQKLPLHITLTKSEEEWEQLQKIVDEYTYALRYNFKHSGNYSWDFVDAKFPLIDIQRRDK